MLSVPDSSSHHGSIQGESDSESELLSTISSTLDGLISSDSSDPSDLEEDPFDSTDKPVFLTSKGPVHVDAVGQSALSLSLSCFSRFSPFLVFSVFSNSLFRPSRC